MQIKILITRPKLKDKDKFKNELKNKIKRKVLIDIIEVVKFKVDLQALEENIKLVDYYDIIGFTSQNAVELFYEFLVEKGHNLEKFKSKNFVAIGEKTAKKIKSIFNPTCSKKVIFPSSYSTEDLQKFLSSLNKRCLIFRSYISNKIKLPNVKEVYFYTLVPNIEVKDVAVIEKNYDYIILTSSYITKVFFETIQKYLAEKNLLDISQFFYSIGTKFVPIGPLTYQTILKFLSKEKIIDYPDKFTIEDTLKKLLI